MRIVSALRANDEVVAWNKSDTRLFHRPQTSMGLNFRKCHPAASLAKVEQIVAEMKDGRRDKARGRQPRMAANPLSRALGEADFRRVSQRPVIQQAAQVFRQMFGTLIAPRGLRIKAFADDALQAPRGVRPERAQ